MSKQLYIAYGSNLNREQMAYRCPTAKPIGKGLVHDHRLVFQGHPNNAHANIIPEAGQTVPVVVWEIGPRDEAALDRYEGVEAGYYTKEYMDIEVGGETKNALVYIMTPHDFGIPDDYYVRVIAQGYKDFGLPVLTLNQAIIHAHAQVRKKAANR